jgi:Ca2+-binding RTX toxin-like protein
VLTDAKRAAFEALAEINWEFVFARIPPQVPALVTSLLLFAAVATDALEVALEQLQELVFPDAVAQEIRELVLLNAPLKEFLDDYYGDSSEVLDALLGNRGYAPDVYVGDLTLEEGKENTLTISFLDRPAKEGGEAIVLSVSDPSRVSLKGPSVSVLDPQSGRYRLVVPEGLTGLQILVEAHGDVDGQDNTVLIQAQSIPFSELGEEFRDVFLGTGRVEITDSAESISDTLVLGTEHDDQTLVGTPASDEIRGLGGDDGINGNAGDDNLDGGSGADIIRGEAGDDQLDGGVGRDILKGGLGEDVLYGRTESDSISGADGNDYLNGGEGDDLLAGARVRIFSTVVRDRMMCGVTVHSKRPPGMGR